MSSICNILASVIMLMVLFYVILSLFIFSKNKIRRIKVIKTEIKIASILVVLHIVRMIIAIFLKEQIISELVSVIIWSACIFLERLSLKYTIKSLYFELLFKRNSDIDDNNVIDVEYREVEK